jgi:hypothetical protein
MAKYKLGKEIARDSIFAVAQIGLGTASRFGLLAKHRSGVRFSLAREAVLVLTRTTPFTKFTTLCG